METITVKAGGRYQIQIEPGAIRRLSDAVKALDAAKVAVVTDENVWRYYHSTFEQALAGSGCTVHCIVLPAGEQSKSFAALERICGELAEQRFGRGDVLIAFGGGVVGDVCGFAASAYMRGVRFIQLPTTLLAQVDSSVGGKTAINIPQGKNLVGAFYQPQAVLIDTDLLKTLPQREWQSGMAEVIKYGAIASRQLFDALGSLKRGDANQLEAVIADCCRIKSEIVAQDEFDTGLRMLLNFGHTFGHAIEALGDFTAHTHGEAVAMGMALAAKAGCLLGRTPPQAEQELVALLTQHGLQTDCPYPTQTLFGPMLSDKKAERQGIRFILLEETGKAVPYLLKREELGQLLPQL